MKKRVPSNFILVSIDKILALVYSNRIENSLNYQHVSTKNKVMYTIEYMDSVCSRDSKQIRLANLLRPEVCPYAAILMAWLVCA